MGARIAILTVVLTLGLAAIARGSAADSGSVMRIDPPARVVVLHDGRMYRASSGTVFLVDNRPVALNALRAGQHVVIQAADPVVFRDGKYIALPSVPATPIVTEERAVSSELPKAPASPPAGATAEMPNSVRQTIYGTVTGIDRDGTITVRSEQETFEARVSADALAQIRKGDRVVIDLTINPN